MSDTFRRNYKPLTEEAGQLIDLAKTAAEFLEVHLRKISNREMSLAITNLEQCIMWATKAIVLDNERQLAGDSQQ